MKKILTLICAVALVSGANAQVKQAKAREMGNPHSVMIDKTYSPLTVEPVKGAAVKAGVEDTLWAEAAYQAGSAGFGGLYGFTGKADWTDFGTIPCVYWPTGTGWANFLYGSGEIGYTFDLSDNGWLSVVGRRKGFNKKGVVGAITRVGRAESSIEEMNEKEMPLRFKLYTMPMGQVTPQLAYVDISSSQAGEELVEVIYPNDPEKYVSLSNVMNIPWLEPQVDPETGKTPYVRFGSYGARFETPGVAGDFVSISIIFPNEHGVEDTLWNATLTEFADEGSNYIQSERACPMYVVWDFQYQEMWSYTSTGEPIRERLEGFIPDSAAQPNDRYAITPRASWWWTSNGNRTGQRQDGEVIMMAIFADGVDMERGAYYDKYVEVKLNPAVDHTVLQSPDRIKNVEIYNLSGKLVKTQACNSQIETISLQGLTSGMYIAKVTTEAGIANKKIMVR